MQHFGFKLNDSFIDKFKNIEPPFGFNGLGKLAYLRTYSRELCEVCNSRSISHPPDNGSVCDACGSTKVRNEHYFETIRRVVEGTYSIQKEHILKLGLGWN